MKIFAETHIFSSVADQGGDAGMHPPTSPVGLFFNARVENTAWEAVPHPV